MVRKILLDTNILISAFRKNEESINFLNNKSYCFFISDIKIMEIFAGCKTLQKRKGFETALKFYGRASFTDSVSGKAISLIKRYTVRDVTLHIPDMLFAATAINYNLPLKTLNVKDFDFNRELELI